MSYCMRTHTHVSLDIIEIERCGNSIYHHRRGGREEETEWQYQHNKRCVCVCAYACDVFVCI